MTCHNRFNCDWHEHMRKTMRFGCNWHELVRQCEMVMGAYKSYFDT